ncbi:MAG: FG-GAP repeat domain-containing protein [Candidatus Polarisedimenticolia bacterium]
MGRFHRVLLVSVVFTVAARLASAACPPFDPPSTVAVGDHPSDLAAGDVNGDGFPDLVVANADSDNVTVLLGDGAGSFTVGPWTPVLDAPRAVVLTDFNGDSRLDLAVIGARVNDVNCQTFLGNGNGTFTLTQSLERSVALDMVTGDFNGDGHVDIAILDFNSAPPDPPTGGYAVIYLGNGDGTVRFRGLYATPLFGLIVTSDFNGDGHPDLAVRSSGRVTVLLGVGDGSFSTMTAYVAAGDGDVAAGDLDGDGRIDLVAADLASDGVSVLLGVGNGAFGAETRYPSGDGPSGIAVVDLFGRGVPDILTVDRNGDTVSLLGSHGDGSVGPPTEFAVGDFPVAISVADFDLDGRLDVAVANYNADTVSVLLGKRADRPWIGFETPETIVWQAVPGAVAYNVYRGALADLVDPNADGLPDGGYGACFDDHDPDLSDTSLVDAETPSAGAGFFYVASVVGSSGDQGIGLTSACLPRAPSSVCP